MAVHPITDEKHSHLWLVAPRWHGPQEMPQKVGMWLSEFIKLLDRLKNSVYKRNLRYLVEINIWKMWFEINSNDIEIKLIKIIIKYIPDPLGAL